MAGITLLRPDRKDLDALAAGANALLDRLPRPDAALLFGGIALREPPKWNISLTHPKLAPIAEPRIATPEAPRTMFVATLPRPAIESHDALKSRDIGPVANVGLRESAPASTQPQPQPQGGTELPTVSSHASVPAVSSVTARARHLVAVHMISPRYPDYREVKEPVRVDVQFSLNADGSVRDVAAVTGSETEAPFGASAEKAMRQWRFDPSTVPGDLNARFQQSFVFAKQSDVHHRSKASDGEEFDCVRRTGSLVCRHPREEEVALPLTIIEANPNVPLIP